MLETNVNKSAEIEKRRASRKQANAILELEGYVQTPQSIAVDNAVINGIVTSSQVVEEMVTYAKQNKSLKGFYESRTWL